MRKPLFWHGQLSMARGGNGSGGELLALGVVELGPPWTTDVPGAVGCFSPLKPPKDTGIKYTSTGIPR